MRRILQNILQRNISTIYDAKTGGTRKVSCVKESDFNMVQRQFLFEMKRENEKKIAALEQRRTDLIDDRDELELGVDSDERKRGFMTGRIHELDLQIDELKKTNNEL